jgi:hypothetical protein
LRLEQNRDVRQLKRSMLERRYDSDLHVRERTRRPLLCQAWKALAPTERLYRT